MSIVCGLDLHRQQITFDAVETESGEVWRGRVWQPDRERFRRWLCRDVARRANGQPVAMAVEGCTGWRYVVEEITAAGFEAHSGGAGGHAGGAGPQAARQDRSFRRSAAARVVAVRRAARVVDPADGRVGVAGTGAGLQVVDRSTPGVDPAHPRRVVPARRRRARRERSARRSTRDRLLSDEVDLTPAGRQRVRVGYSMLEATDVEAQLLKRDLQRFGHRQPACRALVEANYGIGGLIAVAVWSELGDCRRFSRSEQVVRHTGLDVSVDASDRHRAHGYLTRQGPPTLRWALFEAAMNASHRRSPDHAYYTTVKDRHDGKLAAIAVARQFARRCYHILRNLDPDVVYAMPA